MEVTLSCQISLEELRPDILLLNIPHQTLTEYETWCWLVNVIWGFVSAQCLKSYLLYIPLLVKRNSSVHKIFSNKSGTSLKRLSLIHISEPTRLLSISYAVFCLKKKKKK